VHYIGYGNEFDEWKDECDIENILDESNENDATEPSELIAEGVSMCYQPFSLYNELRLNIKRSLTCGRKASPLVKIFMAFDFLFNGGMKCVGVPAVKRNGSNISS